MSLEAFISWKGVKVVLHKIWNKKVSHTTFLASRDLNFSAIYIYIYMKLGMKGHFSPKKREIKKRNQKYFATLTVFEKKV